MRKRTERLVHPITIIGRFLDTWTRSKRLYRTDCFGCLANKSMSSTINTIAVKDNFVSIASTRSEKHSENVFGLESLPNKFLNIGSSKANCWTMSARAILSSPSIRPDRRRMMCLLSSVCPRRANAFWVVYRIIYKIYFIDISIWKWARVNQKQRLACSIIYALGYKIIKLTKKLGIM